MYDARPIHDQASRKHTPRPLLTFSRRNIMRSFAGAALAAPFLARRSAKAAGLHPRNLVLVTWPDGLETGWHPEGEETRFRLGARLAPFAPVQDKLLIVGGLKSGISTELDAHTQGPLTLWTGARPGPGKSLSSLASIDEVVGRTIGAETPFRSLHFGVQSGIVGPLGNPGHVHFAGANQPIPAEDDPAAMFDQVFGKLPGADAQAIARLRRRRGSVLNFVKDQLAAVRREVAADDRPKVDEHVAGVESLEKTLAGLGQVQCTSPPRPSVMRPAALQDANFAQVCGLQRELLIKSLQCGVTRVATLRFSNTDGQIRIPGVNDSFVLHTVMHERPTAERIRINDFFVGEVGKLLQALDAVSLGEGHTLLDDTLVVCATEMAVGNHKNSPMPFFVAGGGGGYFKLGRWLHLANTPRHTRLLTSVLQAMGVPDVARYGEFDDKDSVGALDEVRQ